MQVEVGVAKVNKYASSESGDTLEVVERPHGGLSIVLADGQRSGKSAKRISNMVVRKVISLLAEGVRDGAAARAASDYLYAERLGKVQSTLNILSIDLSSNSVVITRNNPSPIIWFRDGQIETASEESVAVGILRNTRPVIKELPLERGLYLIAFTDGLVHAGVRTGKSLEIEDEAGKLIASNCSAQHVSDSLLSMAVALDEGRPVDDISVVTLRVFGRQEIDTVRRMTILVPLEH